MQIQSIGKRIENPPTHNPQNKQRACGLKAFLKTLAKHGGTGNSYSIQVVPENRRGAAVAGKATRHPLMLLGTESILQVKLQ